MFRLVTLSDVLTKKNGGRPPTTFDIQSVDINDVMRGCIMKRQKFRGGSRIFERGGLIIKKLYSAWGIN